MVEWTIGADPELFLFNKDDSFYSAYDALGTRIHGVKDKPEPKPYGALQVDGMAVEFNINPATSVSQFDETIEAALEDIATIFDDKHIGKQSFVEFPDGFIESQPKAAVDIGCSTDYGTKGQQLTPPNSLMPFRTAGGHIHIGWLKGIPLGTIMPADHFVFCTQISNWLTFMTSAWIKQQDKQGLKRKRMYGDGSVFRPKTYGLEWRTPSNFWIFDKSLRDEMYRRVIAAMNIAAQDAEVLTNPSAYKRQKYREEWETYYVA